MQGLLLINSLGKAKPSGIAYARLSEYSAWDTFADFPVVLFSGSEAEFFSEQKRLHNLPADLILCFKPTLAGLEFLIG